MPETLESSRKWSGFVCPDCRFVFRVPQDHDGQGVVCPSCRRMLKIPAAGDRSPPLVMPLRTLPVTDPPPDPVASPVKSRRRTHPTRKREPFAWNRSSGHEGRRRRGERRRMLGMLIGGATLFVMILVGTLMAMRGRVVPAAPSSQPANNQSAAQPSKPVTAPAAATQPSEDAFLAAAEPLTRKFLDARRIEELLPLVRNPAVVEARMRRLYPDGKIEAPGMAAFNPQAAIIRRGMIISLRVQTRDYQEKSISYLETPRGIKIDWDGWVGWSDMPWQEFLASKPTTGNVFRVTLSDVDYYNFAFADDKKWQAYRLESPDGTLALYGYAERGSPLNGRLRPPPDSSPVPMMLALKFPANATSANQVLIEQCLAEGWVEETEPSP